MPVIKEHSDDWDFKVAFERMIGYAYLDKNIFITRKIENEKFTDYRNQEAIKVHDTYGIMIWEPVEKSWKPAREEIQKAYSDHSAENAIFKDKDKPCDSSD